MHPIVGSASSSALQFTADSAPSLGSGRWPAMRFGFRLSYGPRASLRSTTTCASHSWLESSAQSSCAVPLSARHGAIRANTVQQRCPVRPASWRTSTAANVSVSGSWNSVSALYSGHWYTATISSQLNKSHPRIFVKIRFEILVSFDISCFFFKTLEIFYICWTFCLLACLGFWILRFRVFGN